MDCSIYLFFSTFCRYNEDGRKTWKWICFFSIFLLFGTEGMLWKSKDIHLKCNICSNPTIQNHLDCNECPHTAYLTIRRSLKMPHVYFSQQYSYQKQVLSYRRHYNRGSSSNIPVELTLGCCWAPLVNLAASLLMVGKLGWVCSLDTRAAKEGPSPGWMRLLALSHLRHYYSHKTGKWQTSEIFCLVFLLSFFSEFREWNKPSRTWRSNVKKTNKTLIIS